MNMNKNISNNKENKDNSVPIMDKALWTIKEASMATGIGLNTIRRMTKGRNNPFVFWVGNKCMIKREKFLEYIDQAHSI